MHRIAARILNAALVLVAVVCVAAMVVPTVTAVVLAHTNPARLTAATNR